MTWLNLYQRLWLCDWLFWSLVVFDFVWLALPPLVFLLFGPIRTQWVDPGMDDAALPLDPRFYNHLRDLGLLPVGVLRTFNWLTHNGWCKREKHYLFVGGEGWCLVLVGITREAEMPYFRFLTYYQYGYSVATTNEFAANYHIGKHVVMGFFTGDVGALASAHFQQVDRLVAAGHVVQRFETPNELLNKYRYGKMLPCAIRNLIISFRLSILITLFMVPMAAVFTYGYDPLLMTVGLLFMNTIPLYVWLRTAPMARAEREFAILASRQAGATDLEVEDQPSESTQSASVRAATAADAVEVDWAAITRNLTQTKEQAEGPS